MYASKPHLAAAYGRAFIFRSKNISEEPATIGHRLVRGDKDDGAIGIGEAERQHLRHERPNLPRREINHGGDLPARQLFEPIIRR